MHFAQISRPPHDVRAGNLALRKVCSVRGSVTTTAATEAGATARTSSASAAKTATTASAARTSAGTAEPATRFLRTGLINSQVAAIVVLAIGACDRCLGLIVGTHLDKAKPLGAAGFTIHDHLGRSHGAELVKNLFQTTLIHTVGQIAHVKLSTQLTRSMK